MQSHRTLRTRLHVELLSEGAEGFSKRSERRLRKDIVAKKVLKGTR
jgi:hypothetical protein